MPKTLEQILQEAFAQVYRGHKAPPKVQAALFEQLAGSPLPLDEQLRQAFEASGDKKAPAGLWSVIEQGLQGDKTEPLDDKLRQAFEASGDKKAPAGLWSAIEQDLQGDKTEPLDNKLRQAFEASGDKKAPAGLWSAIEQDLQGGETEPLDDKLRQAFEASGDKKAPVGLWSAIEQDLQGGETEPLDNKLRQAFEEIASKQAPADLWWKIQRQLSVDLVWERLQGSLDQMYPNTSRPRLAAWPWVWRAALFVLACWPYAFAWESPFESAWGGGLATAEAPSLAQDIKPTSSEGAKIAAQPLSVRANSNSPAAKQSRALQASSSSGQGRKALASVLAQKPSTPTQPISGLAEGGSPSKGLKPLLAANASVSPLSLVPESSEKPQVLGLSPLSPQALAQDLAEANLPETLREGQDLEQEETEKNNNQGFYNRQSLGTYIQAQQALILNEETRAGFYRGSLISNRWITTAAWGLVYNYQASRRTALQTRLGYHHLAQGYNVFEQGRYLRKNLDMTYGRLSMTALHTLWQVEERHRLEFGLGAYAGYLLSSELATDQANYNLTQPYYAPWDYGLNAQLSQTHSWGGFEFVWGLQLHMGLNNIFNGDNYRPKEAWNRTQVLEPALFMQLRYGF